MFSTKSNPLLTIIIPTYNSEITLDVALKSIIHQTFRDLEVLIMDGLSTDSTVEIAKKYQTEFPNIKFISKKDEGIYDAMNKGINIAQGKWLYFMGSDDSLYETSTLEKVLNNNKLTDYDIIYGNVYSSRFFGIYDGEFTYSKLSFQNICHQAIFFQKIIFKKTGKFNIKYQIHADWDHNIKWFFSSRISKVYVDQIIANYADDGFSSRFEDDIFEKDKYLKLILKGFGKFPISHLINYCNQAINAYTWRKAKFKIIILTILKSGLKVIYKFHIIKKRKLR